MDKKFNEMLKLPKTVRWIKKNKHYSRLVNIFWVNDFLKHTKNSGTQRQAVFKYPDTSEKI